MNDEELKEIEEFYTCGLLAWHDKGERAETDIVRLIKYIKELENELEGYNCGTLCAGNCR